MDSPELLDLEELDQYCNLIYEIQPWIHIHSRIRWIINTTLHHINNNHSFPWMRHPVHESENDEEEENEEEENIENISPSYSNRRSSKGMKHNSHRHTEYQKTVIRVQDIIKQVYFTGVKFWNRVLKDENIEENLGKVSKEWSHLISSMLPVCKNLWPCMNMTFLPSTRTKDSFSAALFKTPYYKKIYKKDPKTGRLKRNEEEEERENNFTLPVILHYHSKAVSIQALSIFICTGMTLLETSIQGGIWSLLPSCLTKDIQEVACVLNKKVFDPEKAALIEKSCCFYWKEPEETYLPWYSAEAESEALQLLIHNTSREKQEIESMIFSWIMTSNSSRIYFFCRRSIFATLCKRHHFRVQTTCAPVPSFRSILNHSIFSPRGQKGATRLPPPQNSFYSISTHMGMPSWPRRPKARPITSLPPTSQKKAVVPETPVRKRKRTKTETKKSIRSLKRKTICV